MKARLGWLVAVIGAGAVALSAAAQGSAKLAVGPDAGGYLCPDGRQLYVKSCYDDLPDANCGVLSLDRWTTGTLRVQAQATKTRSDVQKEVSGCKLYPVAFDNGVVSLVLPKSAPPQQTAKAPAATQAPKTSITTASRTTGDNITVTDGMAIGHEGVRSSLVRISAADETSQINYVDEASRKETPQKDVIAIWSLTAYVDGKPLIAGDAAGWVEYQVDCKQSTFKLKVIISLDRQAKVLKATALDVSRNITKGSVSEAVAGIACKTAPAFRGPRFPSASAAIADAFASAAPKSAAKPAAPAAQPNAAAQARLDLLEQADTHFVNDDFELAIPLYERAMELDPKDVETAEQICLLYVLNVEAAEKAIIACERLLKLNPKNSALPHQAIAQLQQKRGDNRKALVSALEWARLAPGESYSWRTLADIYVALGRNTDALAAVQKAVKLQPKDWQNLAKRGDVYRRLGKSTESIADYKAGIAIWPEGPELHHDLSVVLRAAGRKTEADAEQRLAIDYALSNGRNALLTTSDGSSVSFGSTLAAKYFLEMLEKWDKSAAAKLAAEIKAAER